MTKDLRALLKRMQSWPEDAQHELIDVAGQIETELQHREYLATSDELEVLDSAMAAIDRGEVANDVEIEAAFRNFGSA